MWGFVNRPNSQMGGAFMWGAFGKLECDRPCIGGLGPSICYRQVPYHIVPRYSVLIVRLLVNYILAMLCPNEGGSQY